MRTTGQSASTPLWRMRRGRFAPSPSTGRTVRSDEAEGDSFTSALVVPIVEAGVETGTLAAYAPEAGSFGAEHVRALEALAEDAVPAIASARRFAEAQRTMTDVLTGLRNRKGYDIELERAVAHAQETGQPLSLLILNREGEIERPEDAHDPRLDPALRELASLLVQQTRTSDVVCLRQDGEFGIVLPETAGDAARRFYVRLRDEASRTTFPVARQLTFAVGVAEWRPDETSETFDARATAAVRTSRVGVIELAAATGRARVEDRDHAPARTSRSGSGTRLPEPAASIGPLPCSS